MSCIHARTHCILEARGLAIKTASARADSETPVPTPGNYFSCMEYVQSTLPIALAVPFVEDIIPEELKV